MIYPHFAFELKEKGRMNRTVREMEKKYILVVGFWGNILKNGNLFF